MWHKEISLDLVRDLFLATEIAYTKACIIEMIGTADFSEIGHVTFDITVRSS